MTDSENTHTEPLAPKLTATLFSKFQARYGHKWISQFPNEEIQGIALAEWSDGLAGISPEQLRDGLNAWDGDWPPSLPEFRKACAGEIEPACNDDWLRLGKSIGCFPGAGQPWESYISDVRRCMRDTQSDAKRISYDA